MRRAGRKKKPLTIQPIKCVVMLSSDEENDCIAAEKKENKQLKRIMEFADNNNLIPMKVFRRGIFGRRLRDEVFYKAIRYMRAGKADALIVTNLDAISDGIADSYLKIGAVREAGYRLFSVDEKEPNQSIDIPIWKRYLLSVTEAAQFYHIGEKRLRQIVDIHPNGEFYLLVGNKVLFKKEKFEQFLAESTAI